MIRLQKHTFNAMGSPCSLHFYAKTNDCKAIANTLSGEVKRLEQKYSRYDPASFTSRINQAAARASSIEVDSETAALLDYAHIAWQQSNGLFDITSGVLRKAWNFKQQKLPNPTQINHLLANVGWEKVGWDRITGDNVTGDKPRLTFPSRGFEIDFGGLVKEYAADCVAALALALDINHGLVELGGDIRIIGPHPDGSPWAVGIRHPRIANQLLATINCHAGAIASSGDYERCIIANNKRYGHVLNPKTGWPVRGLISVTVTAEHCLLAGTTSTLALLQGNKGADWLDEQEIPWIAMNDKLEIKGSIQAS